MKKITKLLTIAFLFIGLFVVAACSSTSGVNATIEAKSTPTSIKLEDDNGMYGKHWYTDGKINIVSEKCPNGFHKGHTINIDKDVERKRKEKISKSTIGKHWFNNGKINKFCYECPDGFVKGFLNTRWSKND